MNSNIAMIKYLSLFLDLFSKIHKNYLGCV